MTQLDLLTVERLPPQDPLPPPSWTTLPAVLEVRDRLSAVTNAVVHCDGACEPNPGPGGWGVLIDTHRLRRIELCGGEANTTNNRMEMTAAIVALTVLPAHCATVIVSDSQLLTKGMTIWIANWRRKGFRQGAGERVNVDLWRALDALTTGRPSVTWRWVKGHNGHDDNERADQLADIGLRGGQQNKK